VVDNTLDWKSNVAVPDTAWVSDITYIKTYEGFLYLAVVIDLYSRRVIGWAKSAATCFRLRSLVTAIRTASHLNSVACFVPNVVLAFLAQYTIKGAAQFCDRSVS